MMLRLAAALLMMRLLLPTTSFAAARQIVFSSEAHAETLQITGLTAPVAAIDGSLALQVFPGGSAQLDALPDELLSLPLWHPNNPTHWENRGLSPEYQALQNQVTQSLRQDAVPLERQTLLKKMFDGNENLEIGPAGETFSHPIRVGNLSYAIARRMGLPDDTSKLIRAGAWFHDIGKQHEELSGIANSGKPLVGDEERLMKLHTEQGYVILENGRLDRALKLIALNVARHHHEGWDGKGYPFELFRKGIPIEARIVHAADIFDAIHERRFYRSPQQFPLETALDEMRKPALAAGLDPEVWKALESLFTPPH